MVWAICTQKSAASPSDATSMRSSLPWNATAIDRRESLGSPSRLGVLGDDVDVAEMALEAAFFELAPSAPPAAKKGFGFIPTRGRRCLRALQGDGIPNG